jgi:glycosyltransferase XagB
VALIGVRSGAVRRSQATERPDSGRPGALVARVRDRLLPTARPNLCPEIDCVRNLLPRRVIAAAEGRARSIGLGADRVLICADALTEEAYLAALARSLGTYFEPLDRIARADCPLDDDQLIQAAAAGLLPLRIEGEIVWIIAPRCLTARRLANSHRPRPQWLRSFRLTSSTRLWRFVERHGQNALGRRAADRLRYTMPLLSNAPRPGVARRIAAVALAALAATIPIVVPAVAIEVLAATLCTVFLAAAALRLLSIAFAARVTGRRIRIRDGELPIYTVICPLYREANVVNNLVAAIRALDYPGIMAQTPQAA